MADVFQVLSDCPHCRVQSAVIELIDTSVGEGVAVESTCRMCGRTEELGQLVRPGRSFAGVVDVIAALEAWAEAEGEPDAATFVKVNMGGLRLEEVCDRVLNGQPVATGFDVIAFLFPGVAAGVAGGAPAVVAEEPARRPLPPEALRPQRTRDPDAVAAVTARALATVMVADGEIRAGEKHFLEAFLARARLEPLARDDLRAWRPSELAIPEEPEPVVEAMIRLVHVDRQRDGTEWQVVREYARHWGYPLDRLERLGRRAEQATAPAMVRLWRALRSLFVTERK